jgi:hypothetical protein
MVTSDTQAIEAAAREFAVTVAAALKLPQGWHPPTVIAGCARMAGTYLFRSFGLKLTGVAPGQAVLSVEANQHGPALLQYMATVLGGLGIQIANAPPSASAAATAKPTREFLDTQRLLEPLFAPIHAKFDLTMPQAARAAAGATAVLIYQFTQNFDPNLGFGVAAYGITEGSKTAPDPVELNKVVVP